MKTFHGQLVVVVEAGRIPGAGELEVSAEGMTTAHAKLIVK